MPMKCKTCAHPDLPAINDALVEGKRSIRSIALQYGLTGPALTRHRDNDLPATLVKAAGVAEQVNANTLLARLTEYHETTRSILKTALEGFTHVKVAGKDAQIVTYEAKDYGLALQALSRLDHQLELEARLLGELQDGPTINISLNAEFIEAKLVIVDTLKDFPEAARAVASRLALLESPNK